MLTSSRQAGVVTNQFGYAYLELGVCLLALLAVVLGIVLYGAYRQSVGLPLIAAWNPGQDSVKAVGALPIERADPCDADLQSDAYRVVGESRAVFVTQRFDCGRNVEAFCGSQRGKCGSDAVRHDITNAVSDSYGYLSGDVVTNVGDAVFGGQPDDIASGVLVNINAVSDQVQKRLGRQPRGVFRSFGVIRGGIGSPLGFSQPIAHVVGLLPHGAVLVDSEQQETASEPSDRIDKSLQGKFPQIVGGLLILIGGCFAWISGGLVDAQRRGGWPLGLCGWILFSVGLALIGVR